MAFIILLLVCLIANTEGKKCGFARKCQCYPNVGLITCLRQNLQHVPNFSESVAQKFKYLDLRWNKIRNIGTDNKILRQFLSVDLRENNLNCSTTNYFPNVKTNCAVYGKAKNVIHESTKTSDSLLEFFLSTPADYKSEKESKSSTDGTGTSTSYLTSTSVQFKSTVTTRAVHRSSSLSAITNQDFPITTDIVISSQRTPTTKEFEISTQKSQFTNSESIQTLSKQLLITQIAITSDVPLPSSTEKMTNNFKIPTNEESQEESQLDFYLHVTLGPIGILYVVATLFLLVKYWIRRRNLQRLTM